MTSTVAEYVDLGLEPPSCQHWIPRRSRYCGQLAIGTTQFCIYHGGRRLANAETIVEFRTQMADAVVPVAIQRLFDIILDEDAAYADVMRAAFGIMDRVGLGPVQGLQIDARVQADAPLAAIQSLLTQVAKRLPPSEDPEILDAEVLD